MKTPSLQTSLIVMAALIGPKLRAEAGFFPTNNEQTPEPVQKSRDAVYRYVSLYPSEKPYYFAKDYDEVIEKAPKVEGFRGELIAADLRKCRADKAPTCDVIYAGVGTAFIVGAERTTLITTSHNLDLDYSEHVNFLVKTDAGQKTFAYLGNNEQALSRATRLSFLLYDRHGELVFDSRKTGEYGYPEVRGTGDMVNFQKGQLGEQVVDFSSIKLSRPLGASYLTLRDNAARPGETIYVVGFPAPTVNRQFLDSAPDSDGVQQYYSTGTTKEQEAVLLFHQGPSYGKVGGFTPWEKQAFSFNDSDVYFGYSGGPVVDQNGLVVGIQSGFFATSLKSIYMINNSIVLSAHWIKANLEKHAP